MWYWIGGCGTKVVMKRGIAVEGPFDN